MPVVHELGGVGANLQDHLQLRMIYKVQGISTLNGRAGSFWGRAMMGLEYALLRSGPLAMAPSQLGGFLRSSPEVAWPDLEFHVQPLSLDRFGDPLPRIRGLHGQRVQSAPDLARPRGHPRSRCRQRAAHRALLPVHRSRPLDRRPARCARPGMWWRSPRWRRIAPRNSCRGRGADRRGTARAAGDIGTTIFHPVGTLRHGAGRTIPAPSPTATAGTGHCRLRVIDASVMPTITSGNTNAPTIMIAERGAQLVRAAR